MPAIGPKEFKKTERQIEALDLMADHKDVLLYGGARSAKTTIIARQLFVRGLKRPSRHLIIRQHFNHARTSLWYDTVPKMLAMCFPGLEVHENKTDWFWWFNARDRAGTSEVWLGGLDSKERVDKVLGNEYSTVAFNEVSQMSFDGVTTMHSRVAENSGLSLRRFYDENPTTKKSWSHRMFLEGIDPDSGLPHKWDTAKLQVNPIHNAENLPAELLVDLQNMPKRKRQRFWDGSYLLDIEGALWTETMIDNAKSIEHGEIVKKVIAVDPSVSHTDDSDECGITVNGLDEFGVGGLIADLSGKLSTQQWATRAVNAFEQYEANYIVAEVNQGGDLVEDVIHNVNKYVPVTKVRAATGKFARAEPVAQLYEMGEVWHDCDAPELEEEMTTYVPLNCRWSPNRLDAHVWGMTELVVGLSSGNYNFG